MTELRFYHLQRQSADQALPGLLMKALKNGYRIVVKVDDEQEGRYLNEHLWTYRPDSFLPHGAHEDGDAAYQPVWLTANDDNPNNSDVLVITGTAPLPENFMHDYTMCCLLFDERNDEAVQHARDTWRAYKDNAGLKLTYWQQAENGWVQKQAV